MSEGQQFDEDEIRQFNPEGYEKYKSVKAKEITLGIVAVAFLGLALVIQSVGLAIVVWVAVVIVAWIIYFEKKEHQTVARQNRYKEQRELLELQRESKVMVSKIEAQRAGDIIIAGEGSTIVNRSTLVNSMNKFEQSDPGLAEALKIVGGFVERSQNAEAAEVFNEFNKRIEAGESKVVVSSLWDKLVSLLPGILQLADVASKIIAFIAKLS